MQRHFSHAVVHNYNTAKGSQECFTDLSKAGFSRIGIEIDIGSNASDQAVVLDRVSDNTFPLASTLPDIASAFSGSIVLDLTNRRAWQDVHHCITAENNSLSYTRVQIAIANQICTYFGARSRNANGNPEITLPPEGYGLVCSTGGLKEAEWLIKQEAMSSLFWLPDPAGTTDLIDLLNESGSDSPVQLYYFLPFAVPPARLRGEKPGDVLKQDIAALEAAQIEAIPIGKDTDLLQFREIVDAFYHE